MRVNAKSDPKLINWSNWLQSIGDGIEGEEVIVPRDLCLTIQDDTKKNPNAEKESMKEMISRVFPDLATNLTDVDWLTGRSILTTTNIQRHLINEAINMMPDQAGDQVSGELRGLNVRLQFLAALAALYLTLVSE